MTTVAPLPGSNGPIEPETVEAKPGTSTKRATLPFDEVLDSASEEPTKVNLVGSAPVEEVIEDAASGDEPDDSEPVESEVEPDAVGLISCLTAWQILPPTPPIAPVSAEPNLVGESTDPIYPPTPDLPTDPQAPTDSTQTTPLPPPPPQDDEPTFPPDTVTDSTELSTPPPEAGSEATPTPPAATQTVRLPKTVSAAEDGKIEVANTLEIQAQIPREKIDGTTVAKEHRAMPETTFHNPAKIAPAAFAEGEKLSTGNPEAAPQPAPAAQAPDLAGSSDSQGGASDSHHEQPSRENFAPAVGSELKFEAEAAPTKAGAPVSETAQVIQTIERAIERMHTQGSQRMELRLPMRDGEEVIVKLRVEQGEVKATFQSDSEGLRKALETGWAQVSQTSAERSVKATSTVVESSALPNQSGGNFQHSSGQQNRRGTERDFETSFIPPLATLETRNAGNPARPIAARTSSSNLSLYA